MIFASNQNKNLNHKDVYSKAMKNFYFSLLYYHAH
jgi:hypothetical protein